MEETKEFKTEFVLGLLELMECCKNNNTDTCTITLDYPSSILECDFSFRIAKKINLEDNAQVIIEADRSGEK